MTPASDPLAERLRQAHSRWFEYVEDIFGVNNSDYLAAAARRYFEERSGAHLKTARHLLKEHWSGRDEWWVGNEHLWMAQADDEIRKAIALLEPK